MKNVLSMLVFILLGLTTSYAQIIEVTEIVRGNENPISGSSKQIIDINARLEVSISKKNLTDAIASQFPEYAESRKISDQISSLKAALEHQDFILNTLQNQVNDIDSKTKLVELMVNFLEAVQQEPFMASRYNELMRDFFLLKEDIRPEFPDPFIFQNLNDDLIKLQKEFEKQDDFKFGISVVAFKKDRQGGDRVHIQNFDTYSEREYVTIPRWVTTLSEEQRSELKEVAEVAKRNNGKVLGIFNQLKEQLLNYLPDMTCVSEQKKAIKGFLNKPDNKEKLSEALQKTGNKLVGKIETFTSFFNSFRTDLNEFEITTAFDAIGKFKYLIQNFSAIQVDFNDFEALVSLVNEQRNEVQVLSDGVNACFIALKDQFKSLENALGILIHQQERYVANKEFGEEVLTFGTNNIPEKGYIKLKGTGPRSNGDELEISVYLRFPSKSDSIPEKKQLLEEQSYTMQLVGARSEIAVGLIMANPTNAGALNFDLERKFYFAPSASLLLKFGSRKSYFYNEFVDLGVGLNFASTDFDTDGTPEFGTGLIVTAFKDVLSVGYNYNVTLDTPYWFFGVNLPFTIPGLPVNRVK